MYNCHKEKTGAYISHSCIILRYLPAFFAFLWSICTKRFDGLFLEQRGRKISFGGVGEDGDYRFALAELFGELDRRGDICSARDTAHQTFLAREALCGVERYLVCDDIDLVIDIPVQNIGDDTVADTHLQVGTDSTSRKDGGVFGLDRPDFDIRVLRLEHLADTRDSSARADTGAKAVDRIGTLLHYLKRGVALVSLDVIDIFKLLWNKDPAVLFFHLKSHLQTFLDARTDISGVVDKLDLGAVVADELAPFLADGVGHNDDSAVTFDRADKRQPDTLISAGGLDDDGVGIYEPLLFRLFYHIERGAGLDGTAHVERLEFYKDIRAVRLDHTVEPYERSPSDCLKNIVINHKIRPFIVNSKLKISLLIIPENGGKLNMHNN